MPSREEDAPLRLMPRRETAACVICGSRFPVTAMARRTPATGRAVCRHCDQAVEEATNGLGHLEYLASGANLVLDVDRGTA